MKMALQIFSVLSDGSRLRLLYALRHGELCVCQLIELMELAPSTVSKHLSLLRAAGLVDSRKKGRWVYYRLADQSDLPVIGEEAAPLFQSLAKAAAIRADDKRLRQICREDPEVLCRRSLTKPLRQGNKRER